MTINVNHSEIPDPALVKTYFDDIISSGVLTNNGPYVRRFEEDLKKQTGLPHCLTTSSGTSALELGINALELKGEIITTPFSFIASTSAILKENCTPVFADIDPNTLCIDPDEIKKCITSSTSAILAVHPLGNHCDIDAINYIAKEYNLKVIYDGAHACGKHYKNKSIFAYGDLSTTSFHAYKLVNAGEGGAIFARNPALHEKLYEMRYFGKDSSNRPIRIGTNAKMDEFNAALGKISLSYLTHEISRRKEVAKEYIKAIRDVDCIEVPSFVQNLESNFSYFPILLNNEKNVKSLIEEARTRNIVLRRYFYPLLNQLDFVNGKSLTPAANDISTRIVCLPIYGSLTELNVSKIVNLLQTFQ